MTKKEYEQALSKDAGHPVYLTDGEYVSLTKEVKGATEFAPIMSTKPTPKATAPNPVYDYSAEMAGILADDVKFGKPQPVAMAPAQSPPTPKWTNVATIDGQAPAHPVYGQPGATPPNGAPKGEVFAVEDPWAQPAWTPPPAQTYAGFEAVPGGSKASGYERPGMKVMPGDQVEDPWAIEWQKAQKG